MNFIYEVEEKSGKILMGEMDAENRQEAQKGLEAKGYDVLFLGQKPRGGFSGVGVGAFSRAFVWFVVVLGVVVYFFYKFFIA